jgi:transcriptional regulator with XRE-family HTH domain
MTRAKSNSDVPADPKQEFRRLLRASGWSQAEAARQLGMTPSALSQIVRDNSPVRPSPVTLRLFQLLLARENQAGTSPSPRPSAANPGSASWVNDLCQELNQLDPGIRETVLIKLLGIVKAAKRSQGGSQK